MKVPWSTHLSPSPYDQNSKERFSDPAIFLPGQTRQVKSSIGKEAPGPSYDATSWRLDEAFDLARTADEEYISLWLDHEEGRHQQGALKWLEDRDSRRRNLVVGATFFLSRFGQLAVSDFTSTSVSGTCVR